MNWQYMYYDIKDIWSTLCPCPYYSGRFLSSSLVLVKSQLLGVYPFHDMRCFVVGGSNSFAVMCHPQTLASIKIGWTDDALNILPLCTNIAVLLHSVPRKVCSMGAHGYNKNKTTRECWPSPDSLIFGAATTMLMQMLNFVSWVNML